MDNLSHTFMGVALARVAKGRSWGHLTKEHRSALLWTSILASSCPDADYLWRFFNMGNAMERVSYLLLHRGYTHTFVFAPLEALLAAFVGLWIAGKKAVMKDVLWLSLLACLLHIVADYFNEYGIHPFSPIWNRWFYGDAIFIVEPLLLLALSPLVLASCERKWLKILTAAVVLVALSTASVLSASSLSAWSLITALGLLVGGLAFWSYQVSKSPWTPVAVALALVAIFVLASHQARRLVAQRFSGETVLELALSPSPSNPFCWRAVTVSTNVAKDYIGRVGFVSLLSDWVDPAHCWVGAHRESAGAPLAPTLSSDSQVSWKGEFRSTLQLFERLAQTHCGFRALLRYARTPFFSYKGDILVAGDLRYAFSPRQSITYYEFKPADTCPSMVPAWEPPFEPARAWLL